MHKYARQAYDLGVRYIGGCCGFEPYHIRAIAEEVGSFKTIYVYPVSRSFSLAWLFVVRECLKPCRKETSVKKKIMSNPYPVTEDSRLGDGVWCEVSLCPPTRTHLHLHRRRGVLQKVYPSLQYISLHLPRNLKAWNFTLVATISCKNVETHPQKNDLSCFKSLLVTGLWDIILTSLLPLIQSCSSVRGRGTSQAQHPGQAIYANLKYVCNWL